MNIHQGESETYLNATLAGELHSRVVVAAAQQVLHHHTVHPLLLPHVNSSGLVSAVLLQVLDPPLAQLSALILRLDGLRSLTEEQRELWGPVRSNVECNLGMGWTPQPNRITEGNCGIQLGAMWNAI